MPESQKKSASTAGNRPEPMQQKYEAIFHGLPEGVMLIDRQYKIRHMNRMMEKILGCTREEVVGESCFAVCRRAVNRCSFCKAETVFASGEETKAMCTSPGGDSQGERILEIFDFPLFDRNGEVELVVEYVKDVTEAAKMRRHMREATHLAEIGKMASVVAHEVRNPLNAITGAVRYLNSEIQRSDLRPFLELINEQVQRVNGVMNELLDYVKPIAVEFAPIHLREIVETSLQVLQDALEGKEIRVEIEVGAGLPQVWVDRAQIERAFVNLIQNAIDAMERQGEMQISAAVLQQPPPDAGPLVELRIRDSGHGLGDRDPEELFKPFVTTKTRGTGLGLPIVRKIMDSHHGTIHLKAAAGRGTQVILKFPTTVITNESERECLSH